VDRAVLAVTRALELYGAPVYVRREIVHNKYVVQSLAAKGAVFVTELDGLPPGARVIFSAHGVSPAVREQARKLGLVTIDATCPLVTKVHKEVVRFAHEDYDIVLVGHQGHEEVEGTAGEAPDHVQVVDSPLTAAQVQVRDAGKVVWLSQTTLSVDEARRTAARLRERFPELIDPPSDDICYATQNRQGAVKQIAPRSDVVIVIGSANSSNSVRLVEVALEHGAAQAFRIDGPAEIDPEWLTGASTVGLTSGASVPEVLVVNVLERLASLGFADVEEVTTVSEGLAFALPRELRVVTGSRTAAGQTPDSSTLG
jgi:4-hydroxy-3-methylbut-2-enyl diphosphate reductase